MSQPYPVELTTSDWVDYLADPSLSRDERIAALASYHRRIEYAARCDEIGNLSHQDEKKLAVVREAAGARMKELADHPSANDYQTHGLKIGRDAAALEEPVK